MFEKNEKTMNWTKILSVDTNAPDAPKFVTLDIEVQPRPWRCCTIFLIKVFSTKFLILSTGLPQRRSPPKIAARWRYTWRQHMPLHKSRLGLNII